MASVFDARWLNMTSGVVPATTSAMPRCSATRISSSPRDSARRAVSTVFASASVAVPPSGTVERSSTERSMTGLDGPAE